MSDQRTFGDVGNKKVYENDRVCVWELRLEPGEESPVHRHGLDHILIQIAGDRIACLVPAMVCSREMCCPARLRSYDAAGSKWRETLVRSSIERSSLS